MSLLAKLQEAEEAFQHAHRNFKGEIHESIDMPEHLVPYMNNVEVAMAVTKDLSGSDYTKLTGGRLGWDSFGGIRRSAYFSIHSFRQAEEKEAEGHPLQDRYKREARVDRHNLEQIARVLEGATALIKERPEVEQQFAYLADNCYTDPELDLRENLQFETELVGSYLRISAVTNSTHPLTEKDFLEIGGRYTGHGHNGGGVLKRVALYKDGSTQAFANAMDVHSNYADRALSDLRQRGWSSTKSF